MEIAGSPAQEHQVNVLLETSSLGVYDHASRCTLCLESRYIYETTAYELAGSFLQVRDTVSMKRNYASEHR